MKLQLTLKHTFIRMKNFLNYFALKMILLNISQHFAIYLWFYFAHYDNFLKWYISILEDKLNFLKLFWHHSKSNSKCLKGYLSRPFSLLFRLRKKCLQKFCLIKKRMMVDILDKNVFGIISMSNNLVLVGRFEDHSLVFCSFYTVHVVGLFS